MMLLVIGYWSLLPNRPKIIYFNEPPRRQERQERSKEDR